MRRLAQSDFLQLWERGCGMHPIDRALLALGAALPETSRVELADWPLGRRNAALAELRCRCFGDALRGWVACPECGERLEFELDAGLLVEEGEENDAPAQVVVKNQTFRLPTSRDLAFIAAEGDARRAAALLLDRCCGAPRNDGSWKDADVDEIGEHLARADPLAETRLTLQCTNCQHAWEESLDIASYFWSEIEAHARRMLMDIHTLACAYGWSEAQILALSEQRRALYVEMVRA